MERGQPNEHKLRGIYMSDKTNSPRGRLQIAHIFKQTNFGLGKESKYLDKILKCSNLSLINIAP
jgi:hypothetical protein